jgi:uncharacterized pyridoxamine 5'-phosphate oxidase family protein
MLRRGGHTAGDERRTEMQKTHDFLKKVGVYYLATAKGDQPRLRPFGTVLIYDGKLYIQTGRSKDVAKEMDANPKISISAFDGEKWIRVEATAVADDNRDVRVAMLDSYPDLRKMYDPDDGETAVYYLKDATSTFASFTMEPETTTF